MGRLGWLLLIAAGLLVAASVRIHYMPGRFFGDRVTLEFVAPWR